MKEQYSKLVVGEKYDRFKTEDVSVMFDWDNDRGMIIVFRTNNVTNEFRNIFNEGSPIDFRYCIINKVCFFTLDVSGGNDIWNDFCFSTAKSLYTEENQVKLPEYLRPVAGIPLNLVGIDTHTGECIAIRTIGLPHRFSSRWLLWANDEEVRNVTVEEFNRIADEVYDKYDSYELAKQAAGKSSDKSTYCFSIQ